MTEVRFPVAIAPAALLGLAGCASTHPMMPTPTLYTGAQAKPLFTKAPAEARTPPLDLLFITDRTPATSPDEPEPYTADRSRLMAYGSTTILFGEHTTWDALVKQSLLVERSTSSDLKLGPTKELGRYPRIPCTVAVTPEGLTRAPATVDAHETADRTLQAEIARRLSLSPRKEMVLYIHGVKNTFSDAAFTMVRYATSWAASSFARFSPGPRAESAGSCSATKKTTNRAHSRSSICARRSARSRTRRGSREFISWPTVAGPTCSPPRCPSLPSSRTCSRWRSPARQARQRRAARSGSGRRGGAGKDLATISDGGPGGS